MIEIIFVSKTLYKFAYFTLNNSGEVSDAANCAVSQIAQSHANWTERVPFTFSQFYYIASLSIEWVMHFVYACNIFSLTDRTWNSTEKTWGEADDIAASIKEAYVSSGLCCLHTLWALWHIPATDVTITHECPLTSFLLDSWKIISEMYLVLIILNFLCALCYDTFFVLPWPNMY